MAEPQNSTLGATAIQAPETMVANATDSPLLSGADLPFTSSEGIGFTLHTAQIIGAGAQGTVVHCTGSDGAALAAKISYQPQSVRDRLSRRAVLAYLRSLMSEHELKDAHYSQTHLMPIYGFGQITDEIEGLGESTYDVTVMPLCDTSLGTRTDVSYEEIVGTILPQSAEALHLLHAQRIVHRDVKPKNLYYLNGSIVLGDYGISTVLDEGRDTSSTKIDRRTPGYSPHSSTVQCENDWYALGYTIWTLYNGNVHPHHTLIEADDLSAVFAGQRPVPFAAKDPSHDALGQLIYGLTYAYSKDRLGYEDVQRFLSNPSAFYYADPTDKSTVPRVRPYVFEGVEYSDNRALADALTQNWERGKRHLYTHALEEHFRSAGNADLSVALNDIVETDADTIANQDLGLAKATALLTQDWLTFHWAGRQFALADFDMWANEVGDKAAVEFMSSGLPAWQGSHLPEEFASVRTTLERMTRAASKESGYHLGATYARLALADSQERGWRGCRNADEVFALVTLNPVDFYESMGSWSFIDELCGALAALSSFDGTMALHDEIMHETQAGMANAVLAFFDEACENKTAVRAFALYYGPYAYGVWVKLNAGMYSTTSRTGKSLMNDIASFEVDDTMPVSQIITAQTQLNVQVEKMASRMEQSPFDHEAGLTQGWYVFPTDADAYFSGMFYNHSVPRGFLEAMMNASAQAGSLQAFRNRWYGANAPTLREEALERLHRLSKKVDSFVKTSADTGELAKDVLKLCFCIAVMIGVAALLVVGFYALGETQSVATTDTPLAFLAAIPTPVYLVTFLVGYFVACGSFILIRAQALSTASHENKLQKTQVTLRNQLDTYISQVDSGNSAAQSYASGSTDGLPPVTFQGDAVAQSLKKDVKANKRHAKLARHGVTIGGVLAGMTMLLICLCTVVEVTSLGEMFEDSIVIAQVIYLAAGIGATVFVAQMRVSETLPLLMLLIFAGILPIIGLDLFIALLPIIFVAIIIYRIFAH